MNTETSNRLIHETSPYLLQHAHNPVDWYPWGEEAFTKAKNEDKPLIISIGYSSCHWCHVMEHESFEDPEIAAIMNKYFVCVKVDREERPDVDQVYMEAVQAMGLGGGWPLNAFITPDGKPFYGGTYFPPKKWVNVLQQLSKNYQDNREKVTESAEYITQQLQISDAQRYGLEVNDIAFTKETQQEIFNLLESKFDYKWGGLDRAPKFPMPSIYLFLLRHFHQTNNGAALDHVSFTLEKMAQGGIYDQIGGGFARYSTDHEWFAPHFEKMLYDNGQLVSLYAEAFKVTKNPLFKEVVYETCDFIEREMLSEEGAFYSALDADSEGEEGKYYVWSYEEIEKYIGDDAPLFNDYYKVTPAGNWELDNILFREKSDSAFAEKHGLTIPQLHNKIKQWKDVLLPIREKRSRPGLDDKALVSWNAIMLKGYIDAYKSFGDERFLQTALLNASFLEAKMLKGQKLSHTYSKGKATIEAYLDDYSLLIDAYIHLYQVTFNEKWLTHAQELTEYCLAHFYDEKENSFFYTNDTSEKLIARKKELFDNVIPSSNAIMATNLYWLSKIFDNEEYATTSLKMMSQATPLLTKEPSFLAHWGCLYTYYTTPTAEIVISGENALTKVKDLFQNYLPNVVVLGSTSDNSTLPLLQEKQSAAKDAIIYVCYNKTCQMPTTEISKAIELIKN